jgi:hypothetical protein
MKLVFDDGREVALEDKMNVKIRKREFVFDWLAIADQPDSCAHVVFYGAQRILNDAAGVGETPDEQFASAMKKWDALVSGETRVVTREDSLTAIAIEKAIDHVVKVQFKKEGKKLEPKAMREAAKKIIERNPAYMALAQIELDRRAKEREEEKAFLAKAELDMSAIADLRPAA